ncbi:16760_t:CDS:2, partial [Funneliformis geosporum]
MSKIDTRSVNVTVEIQNEVKLQKTKHNNYLQEAFKLGIIKEKSTFMLAFDKHARYMKLVIDEVPFYNFRKELKTKDKSSHVSTIQLSTSSNTPEAILLSDDPTSDSYIPEIMAYFISRGFQPSLV